MRSFALIAICLAASSAAFAQRSHAWRSKATGGDVSLSVYPSTTLRTGSVILLEHLAGPVGREKADPGQIRDFCNEGLSVVTVDYSGNARAVSPWINIDFLALRNQLPSLTGAAPSDTDLAFILPAGFRLHRNVPFSEENGHVFAMDIWLPPAGKVPVACVLQYAHNNAVRMAARNFTRYKDTVIDGLATLGFAVAMADHPMPPPFVSTYKMPDVVFRARAAIRTLRSQVAKTGMTPGRVGVVGFSRAGAIAAFMALAGMKKIPGESGPYREFSNDVQAALCASGRYDLPSLASTDSKARTALVAEWGEASEHPSLWRDASPTTYVSAGDPPVFVTVGAEDQAFRVEQAKLLAATLDNSHVEHHLAIEQGIAHALPTAEATVRAIDDFFILHLSTEAPEQTP